MKKAYHAPETHWIQLNPDVPVSTLADAPEEELERTLEVGGYDENRVCYQINPEYITRRIAGEVVAVPVGRQSRKLNGMITFSNTGAFLWDQLAQRQTKADLIVLLMNVYGKTEAEVAGDVGDFLDKAYARGLLVRQEA